MPETAKRIQSSKRIVVKIGSAVLAENGLKRFNRPVMASLAEQIARARSNGRDVVLVSSGAILAGAQKIGVSGPIGSIGDKQALAAIGQVELMDLWKNVFAWHDVRVGQILLTRDDLSHRRRFLNARRTMESLLEKGVLPIVNENDTVMVEEIKFGDNDRLSALITNVAMADLLVLLTEVEGVFDADPRLAAGAELLPRIEDISQEIIDAAGTAGPSGRGGMASKIEAAHMARLMGVPTVIANGRNPGALDRILQGEAVGTVVLPSAEPMDRRKHWIAFTQAPLGTLTVDGGAVNALVNNGKSLLPSGIVSVQGTFDMGDLVEIADEAGRAIARGLTNYSAAEVEKIKGRKSQEIESLLGYQTSSDVVHRDHMIVGDVMWRKS